MARCPLVRKSDQTDRGMEEVEGLKITAGPEVGPSPLSPSAYASSKHCFAVLASREANTTGLNEILLFCSLLLFS